MNYRLFLTATAVIVLTSMTMAQQPPQSHPLSEIYPVDTDLDMEDYGINNLSQLSLNDGSGNTGLLLNDYTISGEGEAQRFVLDYQNDVWSVENSGLELNGNNISGLGGLDGFFDSACSDGEAVTDIMDNGSVVCSSVESGASSLSEVLEVNNTANQSIEMPNGVVIGEGAEATSRKDVVVGYEAARGNTEDYVTALGYRAGRNNAGIDLVALGYNAGWGNEGN